MTCAIASRPPIPSALRLARVRWPVRVVATVALLVATAASATPVRPLGAAAVAVLVGLAGRGLVGGSTGVLPWAARGGVAVGAGALLAAVALLGLADGGWFGPVGVGAVGFILAGAAVAVPPPRARVAALPVVLLALSGATAAAVPAYAFDVGGRDAGFYVMTSHALQDEGGLRVALDRDVQEAMDRFAPAVVGTDAERPLPGFFVGSTGPDGTTSAVVPHGYHLVPSLMAGGGTVTGGGGQWVVTFLGGALVLLAAGAAAALVRSELRPVAGVVAGALLAGNAALIYFSRYPMTEVPSGVVLMTAGLAAAAALRGGGARAAALAGLALGAAPLVRPDAWPLMAVAPLTALLLAGRDRGLARAFAAGLAPAGVLAAVRALTASEGYTKETIGYVLGGVSPAAVVVALTALAVAGAVVAALVPAGPLRRTGELLAHAFAPRRLRRVLAAVVLVATAVLVARPPSLGLEILQEYATRPGALLAGAGVAALLLAPTADRRRVLAAVPLLALATLALALVARNPQVLVPDQYWTARRYLPLALPVAAALAGAAVALAWGARRRGRPGRLAAGVAPLLVLLALVGSLTDARQAVVTTEFDGVPEGVERIDGLLSGRDPLVLAGPGYTSWGVLGPALALRQRRDVVMLAAGDPQVATLDDPAFSRWLGRVARRRPVYLVTANVPPTGIASDARDVRPETTGTVTLPITQIEQRVGGPPTIHRTQTDLVSVLRLWPGTGR